MMLSPSMKAAKTSWLDLNQLPLEVWPLRTLLRSGLLTTTYWTGEGFAISLTSSWRGLITSFFCFVSNISSIAQSSSSSSSSSHAASHSSSELYKEALLAIDIFGAALIYIYCIIISGAASLLIISGAASLLIIYGAAALFIIGAPPGADGGAIIGADIAHIAMPGGGGPPLIAGGGPPLDIMAWGALLLAILILGAALDIINWGLKSWSLLAKDSFPNLIWVSINMPVAFSVCFDTPTIAVRSHKT